jgi:hypothetical protein
MKSEIEMRLAAGLEAIRPDQNACPTLAEYSEACINKRGARVHPIASDPCGGMLAVRGNNDFFFLVRPASTDRMHTKRIMNGIVKNQS